MKKQKYYKVVRASNEDGRYSPSTRDDGSYRIGQWSFSKDTKNKTPFFVFTNEMAAYLFCDYDQLVFECEVGNTSTSDKKLGDIANYKDHAVFTDKFKLTKEIAIPIFTELKPGMIFRVKRTKTYVVWTENWNLMYITGKAIGQEHDNHGYDNLEGLLLKNPSLVYIPKGKVTVTA